MFQDVFRAHKFVREPDIARTLMVSSSDFCCWQSITNLILLSKIHWLLQQRIYCYWLVWKIMLLLSNLERAV